MLGVQRVASCHLKLILLVIKYAISPEIMVKGDGSLTNDGTIKGKWRGLVAWLREAKKLGLVAIHRLLTCVTFHG